MYEGQIDKLYTVDLKDHNKRIKKFQFYTIARLNIIGDFDESINHVLLNGLIDGVEDNKILTDCLEKLIFNEKVLLDSRREFSVRPLDLLNAVLFLLPLQVWDENNQMFFIIPVMYIFNDGRQIVKFSYTINQTNQQKDYGLKVGITKFSFFKVKNNVSFFKTIKIENFIKYNSKFNEGIEDLNIVIEEYFREILSFYKYDGLIQNYTNIMITKYGNKYKKNMELEKLLFSLSKYPFESQINLNALEKRKVNMIDMLFFSNMNRTVSACNKDLYTKIIKNGEVPFAVNVLGAYQSILDSILLKKFTNMKLGTQFIYGNRMNKKMKNNKKEQLLYTMHDNMILFTNYETVLELYNELEQKILPSVKMSLLEEVKSLNLEVSKNEIEDRISSFQNTITLIGFLLTVVFSYEPIEKIMCAFNLNELVMTSYLMFNFLILIIILGIKFKNNFILFFREHYKKVILTFILVIVFVIINLIK